MSIFFEDHKNIFELLKEDDGSDIINGGDAGATDADSTTDNGGGDADASSTTDNDNNTNDDEDFNIDTSLDDNDTANDDADTNSDNDLDDSSSSSELDSGDSGEANPINKDLFPTLTAEEQAIKIKELKKQYNNMYIYIDDLIDKMNNIALDEDNVTIIERITINLLKLREYLQEYISTTFNLKDYFENDVFFRRFLQVIYSVDSTIQDLSKGRAKKLGLKDDESEKK